MSLQDLSVPATVITDTYASAGASALETSLKPKPYAAAAAAAPPNGSKTLKPVGHLGRLRRITLRLLGAVLGTNLADGRKEAASVPGFNAWLRFAREGKCSLTAYNRITRDLAPFRARGGITPDMLARTKSLPDIAVFTIIKGNLTYIVQVRGYVVLPSL